ncbi:hypothetical protein [Portibacter marinus]|uniref:hypothetical protein n=1 Tax=Portibacter marinus TaxID=2898660 RepID=UPI001F1787A8|nr:hypothetical protein [Portibacter marinus]
MIKTKVFSILFIVIISIPMALSIINYDWDANSTFNIIENFEGQEKLGFEEEKLYTFDNEDINITINENIESSIKSNLETLYSDPYILTVEIPPEE